MVIKKRAYLKVKRKYLHILKIIDIVLRCERVQQGNNLNHSNHLFYVNHFKKIYPDQNASGTINTYCHG